MITENRQNPQVSKICLDFYDLLLYFFCMTQVTHRHMDIWGYFLGQISEKFRKCTYQNARFACMGGQIPFHITEHLKHYYYYYVLQKYRW